MKIAKLLFIIGGTLSVLSAAGCTTEEIGRDPFIFSNPPNGPWKMTEESSQHSRTWMGYSASGEIWGKKRALKIRENLVIIENIIAKYEPVTMLVNPEDYDEAKVKLGPNITLVKKEIDDIWLRDTGSSFVVNKKGSLGAVDPNFNGWGEKQKYSRDSTVAAFMAGERNAQVLNTQLVFEGGAIEIDGEGTAIITESCVVIENRNRGVTKEECAQELKTLFGLKKIIWLPGIRGKDITDGHTDFYVRFVRPGVVAATLDSDPSSYDYTVTRAHLEILRSATDAQERKLEVIVIEGPNKIRPGYNKEEFCAGYINFYIVNGAVLAPEFGDAVADSNAKAKLQLLFPDRVIEMINIDAIAGGGGGIHCVTQQEPFLP